MSLRSLCACITETVGEFETEAPLLVLKRKIWRLNYTCSKLESYMSIILISTNKVEMAEDNCSLATEFILTGFADHPELKPLLFLVFFTIYLITMVGNLGLVALIVTEHRLHTPMYIFLGNLALMDSCCSCAITPKMPQNFFSKDLPLWMYGTILLSLPCWNCRLLSPGSNGLWLLCGHLQTTAVPHHDVKETLHSDDHGGLHSWQPAFHDSHWSFV